MTSIEISNDLFFSNIKNIINSGNPVELKVKGTSMHPTLLNGKHKVVLVPYRKQHLRIGIIALFVYRRKHILHRLVSIDGDKLTFQGDNLSYRECVREGDIIAIVDFIISPTSKEDCRKRWFFIKYKCWLPIYQSHSRFVRKIVQIFKQ